MWILPPLELTSGNKNPFRGTLPQTWHDPIAADSAALLVAADGYPSYKKMGTQILYQKREKGKKMVGGCMWFAILSIFQPIQRHWEIEMGLYAIGLLLPFAQTAILLYCWLCGLLSSARHMKMLLKDREFHKKKYCVLEIKERWAITSKPLVFSVSWFFSMPFCSVFLAGESDVVPGWGFLLRRLWSANLFLQLLFTSSNSAKAWNLLHR